MNIVLKGVTAPEKKSQEGLSGGVPEESSMPLIVPKDLSVGQDVVVEDSDIEDPIPYSTRLTRCLCLSF